MTALEGRFEFTIKVSLGMVDPQAVSVEMCAEARGGGNSVRATLKRANSFQGSTCRWKMAWCFGNDEGASATLTSLR